MYASDYFCTHACVLTSTYLFGITENLTEVFGYNKRKYNLVLLKSKVWTCFMIHKGFEMTFVDKRTAVNMYTEMLFSDKWLSLTGKVAGSFQQCQYPVNSLILMNYIRKMP